MGSVLVCIMTIAETCRWLALQFQPFAGDDGVRVDSYGRHFLCNGSLEVRWHNSLGDMHDDNSDVVSVSSRSRNIRNMCLLYWSCIVMAANKPEHDDPPTPKS